MIAVLMAAGRGSRLGSYTENLPKSLLPLDGGDTLLDHNLDLLEELGIRERLIVTGYESEQIRQHVENREGVHCIYNPFWDACNVLGSLYMALPHIGEEFLFLHADTLAEPSVWQDLIGSEGEMVLPYQGKPCGEEEMKVAHDPEGKLTAISKTIDPGSADGEFLGIARFRASTLSFFRVTSEKLFREGRLDAYMEAVVAEAIDSDIDITTFDIGDRRFVEVDFEEDYRHARELFG